MAGPPVKKGRPPAEIERLINERIDQFVADITELARELAAQTVSGVLDRPINLDRKRGKRSPEELDQVSEQLFAYIEANPDQRMEEIAEAMKMSSRELTLPLRKLLEQKRVRGTGNKRATTYAPARGRRGRR